MSGWKFGSVSVLVLEQSGFPRSQVRQRKLDDRTNIVEE